MVGPMNEIFAPIKQKKISEEIADQLKSLIYQGQLKPGQRLPPERDLAKSLGVSRVSLREALNTLQGMGLLEIQQGNRTFVRPITTLSVYDPLVSFSKGSPANMMQVFELRKYLEVGSISLAAERADSHEIQRLDEILIEMEDDLLKNRLGARTDLNFHITLAEATHNQAYIHVMNTIYDLLQEELRVAWGSVFRRKEKRRKLFLQHKKIFYAVKEHNPKEAAQEALEHLDFVGKEWKESLIKEP